MAVDIRRDRHGGVPEDFECRTVDDRLHGDLLQFKARTQAAYSPKRGLRIPHGLSFGLSQRTSENAKFAEFPFYEVE
jgi:hypothetical protein